MHEINIKELTINPFAIIEDNWFQITVSDGITTNSMTAASGAMGHMFRKNVVYLNIRPNRFTHKLLDKSKKLSIAFFENNEINKKIMKYLGTASGRSENKIDNIPWEIDFYKDIPYFTNAKLVMFCSCIYCSPYVENHFIDTSIRDNYYPKHDYHDLYICSIDKVFIQN